MSIKNDHSIITYISEDTKASFNVKYHLDTVWLTQQQMANLFDTSRENITMHLKNVFSLEELIEMSVCKDFLRTASDRKIYKTKHYNLDAIISIGYRVNSKRGTQFRQWATKILSDKLLRGKEEKAASIYIHAPITIQTLSIKGNRVSASFSYNEKEFSKQKAKLIDLLSAVHNEIQDNPVLKESIQQYQSDIKKSAPGKSTSNRIIHFIKDLGDPNSMTHQILNGAGVGKSVIKKCFELGCRLLDALTSF